MFAVHINSHQWLNDIQMARTELRRRRASVADLHKLRDDTQELIASSKDAVRIASRLAWDQSLILASP
jgi:hypothetical protein